MNIKLGVRNPNNEKRWTDNEWVRMNKFKIGKYKIGQIVRIADDDIFLENNLYIVEQIIDKDKYYMYLCKNTKLDFKVCITDKDDYEIVRTKKGKNEE